MHDLIIRLMLAAPPAGDATPETAVDTVAQTGAQTGTTGSGDFMDKVEHIIDVYGMQVITVIVMVIAAFVIAGWAKKLTTRVLTKAKVDITLGKFLGSMVRYAILLLAGISILGQFGVETTSFAAVIAAMGFAIGMALQGTLGNIASGVMLLIFRPFKVGDVVNAAGVVGKVEEIQLMCTTLDTPDNRRIIVPNSAIFGGTIENVSFHSTRRVDIAVGADYGASIDETRAAILAAVKDIPDLLTDPAPAVVLGDLGDSCVNWTLRVWCNSADFWAVKDAGTRAVKMSLDNAGIGIPFPQMDLHIDGKLAQ